jgi:hypothetical protein
MMLAVANSRRDICLNRCPNGAARCEQWLASSGAVTEAHEAFCPAGAWHEYHYNAARRAGAGGAGQLRIADFGLRNAECRGGRTRLPDGAGTILKRMLGWVGIKAAETCACNRRAAEMDRLGMDWCAANMETIVGWLEEEAGRRGMPFSRFASRWLVRAAIARARIGLALFLWTHTITTATLMKRPWALKVRRRR